MYLPSPLVQGEVRVDIVTWTWVLLQYPMQVQPVGASDGQYHMQADEQQSERPPVKTEGTA